MEKCTWYFGKTDFYPELYFSWQSETIEIFMNILQVTITMRG